MGVKRRDAAFEGPEPDFRGRFAGSAEGFRCARPLNEADAARLVAQVKAIAIQRSLAPRREGAQLRAGIDAARAALAAGDRQAILYLLGELPEHLWGDDVQADKSPIPSPGSLPSPHERS